jgi:arylsulfatase A-like enzyme/tetratricopeptide (TPR) repeat protein
MSRRERKKETRRAPRRIPWKLFLGGGALVAAAASAYLFLPRLVPEARRPLNVILVTADTLRADRLPLYGYDKVETPNLDRMAASGVVFEQATTVVPLTLPAHSSMFTGTFPMHHGVRDNGGYYLGQDQVTLAETLKENGYRTGGFVAAFVLDSRWGLNQGFDHYWDDFDLAKYENVGLDTVQRRGGEVLQEATRWMDTVKEDRFFAWLHFYDVHTPYEAPEPYLSRYKGYMGARYDGEIAYLDSLIGELVGWLEKNDVDEDTMVVFIGDHGESLGQHEETTHGFFIYDATMRVPFLIKAPYRQIPHGLRVPAQVRNVDLMPTILDLVGVPAPATVQGTSLVPLLERESDDLGLIAYSESFYPRHHYGWAELKAVRNGRMHFIDAPRPELFDILEDPQQTKNIARERAGTVQELKDALDELVARYGVEGIDEKAPETPDPDTAAQLAALGYLGGPSKIKIDPSRPLPDPKDKIGLFNLIKDAGADSSEDRIEEAMAKIEKVLAEDPDILEAHYIKGNLFAKQKELEKALEAYKDALTRDPEYKSALFGLATTYQEMGKAKEAELGFQRILELDPRDNRAYYQLAKIHVDRNDYTGALELLNKAVDIGSERAPLHNLMAECYIGMKKLDEAKKEIERALEMNPELPTAHFNLALVHEEENDAPAAIQAYEKELEISPKDFRSHFNVAKLYGKAGNGPKTREHFEKAIESNDKFAIGHLYLAKFYLDSGELEKAQELALKGLELGPEPSMAPLGHFILADVYNRQGRFGDAERELQKAQKLSSS